MASHICHLRDVHIQCLDAKREDWTDIDVAQRLADPLPFQQQMYTTYDAMTPKQFIRDRYRFFFDGCGTIDETAADHQDMADKVAVYVKLAADRAEIKVEFIMSSRDVGFEEGAMKSHMQSVITGKWLECHHQYPTAAQFDEVVSACLKALCVPEWLNSNLDE